MTKRVMAVFGVGLILVLTMVAMMACQSAAPDETSNTCSDCHNDTTVVLAKSLQWEESGHSNFEVASSEGTRNSCAGCHSSEGYVKRIAANITPDKVTEGETNPTPPNCFTCHEIHTTYTSADYALRTVAPVTLYVSGETFNIGKGNLCATCHQPRTAPPTVGGGDVNVSSTHWGPHHSTQSAFILGVGGYGVPSSASPHYMAVSDGCVSCHMVNENHQMAANVAACQTCHSGATSFDVNGAQTEIKGMLEELKGLLVAHGLLTESDSIVVGTYSEAQAGALWNYETIESDGSLGVHNPAYTKSLLQNAINALK
jgi:hypothetical protein